MSLCGWNVEPLSLIPLSLIPLSVLASLSPDVPYLLLSCVELLCLPIIIHMFLLSSGHQSCRSSRQTVEWFCFEMIEKEQKNQEGLLLSSGVTTYVPNQAQILAVLNRSRERGEQKKKKDLVNVTTFGRGTGDSQARPPPTYSWSCPLLTPLVWA